MGNLFAAVEALWRNDALISAELAGVIDGGIALEARVGGLEARVKRLSNLVALGWGLSAVLAAVVVGVLLF